MDVFTTGMYRIVKSFEEAAVEFVLDPSFPLNDPTVITADNLAFTAIKVLNQIRRKYYVLWVSMCLCA